MSVNSMLPSSIAGIALSIPSLKLALQKGILEDLKNSIDEKVIPHSKPSVLKEKSYTSMVEFSWENVISEMNERCPFFLDLLMTIMHKKSDSPFPCSKLPVIATIYGMVMYQRDRYQGLVVRIVTALMIRGCARKELYRQLSHCGICQSHSQKKILFDIFGSHFIQLISDKVKNGSSFHLCFDNLAWMVRASHLDDNNKNRDVHAITTSYVIDRVDFAKMDGRNLDEPKKKMDEITPEIFQLNHAEKNQMREDYIVLVARILAKEIKAFNFMSKIADEPLIKKYADEMRTKTDMRFFEVVFANEVKYNELMRCMDQMEKWIHEIYKNAGLLKKTDGIIRQNAPENPLPTSTRSRRGQPGAHMRPMPEPTDPLREIHIPLSADQLSRVRAAGAKDMRAGSVAANDRYDHLYPILCNLWHAKKSYLNFVYEVLLPKNAAVRDEGTLKNLREKLGRANADNPDKHYHECEDFFLLTGKAYLLSAAKTFFGLSDLNDRPSHLGPSPEDRLSESGIKDYMKRIVGKFVDEYILSTEEAEQRLDDQATGFIAAQSQDIRIEHCYSTTTDNSGCGALPQDSVRNHATALLKMYVFLLEFIDMEKTGNGERLVLIMKVLLLYFKCGLVNRKNYAIEMFVSLAQIEALLSPREAERAIYSRFVNLRGGERNGMATDLGHENGNGFMKDLIKPMGANKTDMAIQRISRASSGLLDMVTNFNNVTNLHRPASRHSTPGTENQLSRVLTVLENAEIWSRKPGRAAYRGFSNLKRDVLNNLDEAKFDDWLREQIRLIPIGNHW